MCLQSFTAEFVIILNSAFLCLFMSVSCAKNASRSIAKRYVGVLAEKLGSYFEKLGKLHCVNLSDAERLSLYFEPSFRGSRIELAYRFFLTVEISAAGQMISHDLGNELSVVSYDFYNCVFKET